MSNISINSEKRRAIIEGKEYAIIKTMEYEGIKVLKCCTLVLKDYTEVWIMQDSTSKEYKVIIDEELLSKLLKNTNYRKSTKI